MGVVESLTRAAPPGKLRSVDICLFHLPLSRLNARKQTSTWLCSVFSLVSSPRYRGHRTTCERALSYSCIYCITHDPGTSSSSFPSSFRARIRQAFSTQGKPIPSSTSPISSLLPPERFNANRSGRRPRGQGDDRHSDT